jgi:predicted nucleotidyltransferase
MGTATDRRQSVASALFSPVQADLLALLFCGHEESYSGAELIRRVGRGSGAVQRQLASLLAAELVTATRVGNQKRYRANRRTPVFDDLRRLLLKSVGVVGLLRDALMTHRDEIAFALVFGSTASGAAGASSDVDLLVVKRSSASLDHAALYEALQGVESTLGRDVAPVLMTEASWRQKRRSKDSFVARVHAGATLSVFEEQDVSGSAREPRQHRKAPRG